MPTETVTVQNVGLAIDWGRIILQVGGLCAISGLMGYAAQRVITVRRNLSYVARRLGLGSLRSDANRQFVRGQTDDGRSICLYLEKPHPMLTAISSGLADLVAAALAWDAGVEIASPSMSAPDSIKPFR
jgi:hypothetical protein